MGVSPDHIQRQAFASELGLMGVAQLVPREPAPSPAPARTRLASRWVGWRSWRLKGRAKRVDGCAVMGTRLPWRPRVGLEVGSKFLLVFAVLVPVICAVPVAGISGLGKVRDQANRLYSDNVQTARLTQQAAGGIDEGFALALRLIPTNDPAYQKRLREQLAAVTAQVNADIAALRRIHAGDSGPQRARVERLDAGWRQFIGLAR